MALIDEQRSSNTHMLDGAGLAAYSYDGESNTNTFDEVVTGVLGKISDLMMKPPQPSQGPRHLSFCGAFTSSNLESPQRALAGPRRRSMFGAFASANRDCLPDLSLASALSSHSSSEASDRGFRSGQEFTDKGLSRALQQDFSCEALPEPDPLGDSTVMFEFRPLSRRNSSFVSRRDSLTSRRDSLTSVSVGILETDAELEDLEKHKILGEGYFGQVHLVSEKLPNNTRRSFALKIQSKVELVNEAQVEVALREKNIMSDLHHPFLVCLIKTYQDNHFIYTLLPMLAGGELYSVMFDHEEGHYGGAGLPESHASFYALCVSDALAYMHKRQIVYRDLKPENVIIDSQGYPVIVDFGLAKRLTQEKTFTMCGTPKYCAPEVIVTSDGHNCSADHWSLGILIYEMVSGTHPFFYEGIDQMSLFQSISDDGFENPKDASDNVTDLICKLLVKDPTERLGSLAGGEREIRQHPWFEGLDLYAMRKRKASNVPWVPTITDPLDTSNFEDWSHLEDKTKTSNHRLSVTKSQQALFEGF